MTALVTPFADGKLDEGALRRLVNDQIDGGVDVLVPVGTTGEGATLSGEEAGRIFKVCVDEAKGRARVVAGVGSNSTAVTIENAKRAKAAGVDGLLVVTPYYNKPTQEGLYRHFEAVAKDGGGLPVILYNVPGRTSVDLLPETVARLAQVPGIVAIKEATGSLTRAVDLLEALDGRPFDLIAGDDALILPILAVGGSGVISVVSNVVPERVAKLIRAFRTGDLKTAQAEQVALNPFIRACFAETNPTPVKAALAMLGRMREELRLPLVPPTEATKARLAGALKKLGLSPKT